MHCGTKKKNGAKQVLFCLHLACLILGKEPQSSLSFLLIGKRSPLQEACEALENPMLSTPTETNWQTPRRLVVERKPQHQRALKMLLSAASHDAPHMSKQDNPSR